MVQVSKYHHPFLCNLCCCSSSSEHSWNWNRNKFSVRYELNCLPQFSHYKTSWVRFRLELRTASKENFNLELEVRKQNQKFRFLSCLVGIGSCKFFFRFHFQFQKFWLCLLRSLFFVFLEQFWRSITKKQWGVGRIPNKGVAIFRAIVEWRRRS